MSGGEIIVIVVAILLLFGADKIPEFARMWGKGMREFRKATDDIRRELESSSAPLDDLKKELTDMKTTVLDDSLVDPLPGDVASFEKHYQGASEPEPESTPHLAHAAWKEPQPEVQVPQEELTKSPIVPLHDPE